jgi:hypothetical protein
MAQGGIRRRLRGLGVWIVHVLDGEQRLQYGWGLLPLGVAIALWAYAYAPRPTQPTPFPPEPEWRIPVMCVGVGLGVVGLFLLVAPWARKFILARRDGEETKRGLVKRTDHTKITKWEDGSQDIEIKPPPATGFGTAGVPEVKTDEATEQASEVEGSDEEGKTDAQPVTGPDTGTDAIAGEDEEMPDAVQEWLSMEEETDDGFILRVVRPPGDEGRLSRCTVTEVGTDHRWSHELISEGGFNFFGESGFDLNEWQVEFPNDFRGGAALIPLDAARYRYVWIANYGSSVGFIGQPSWQTVARGEFRR